MANKLDSLIKLARISVRFCRLFMEEPFRLVLRLLRVVG
jgi:hypothetical protein